VIVFSAASRAGGRLVARKVSTAVSTPTSCCRFLDAGEAAIKRPIAVKLTMKVAMKPEGLILSS
jgi:hypothetical protein